MNGLCAIALILALTPLVNAQDKADSAVVAQVELRKSRGLISIKNITRLSCRRSIRQLGPNSWKIWFATSLASKRLKNETWKKTPLSKIA